jgi:hypothetical protein
MRNGNSKLQIAICKLQIAGKGFALDDGIRATYFPERSPGA